MKLSKAFKELEGIMKEVEAGMIKLMTERTEDLARRFRGGLI